MCPVLTWGHIGRPHTSQSGPVGEGRALSDSDSWLGLRQCQREGSFPHSIGSSGDRPGEEPACFKGEKNLAPSPTFLCVFFQGQHMGEGAPPGA